MADFNWSDFFDSIKNTNWRDKTEKLVKNIARKTENTVDRAKLQYAQRNINAKMDEAFIDLGKYIYNEFSDEDIEGPVKDKCMHIKELHKEMKALNDEMAALKNSVLCDECGAYNSVGNKYCGVCGASLKREDD